MTGDLIFYLLAALTVLPAIWVVMSRNIVHAGFALLFTLLGAAGLYAFLGADFVAVTQLMVYVGGVLVLVLFTVMMTRVPRTGRPVRGLDRFVPPAIFSLAVFGLLYKAISGVRWPGELSEALPTTAEFGANFMTNYIFPFEYVSLILLMAMIGAALLIREQRGEAQGVVDGDEAVGTFVEVTAESPAEPPAAESGDDQEVQS